MSDSSRQHPEQAGESVSELADLVRRAGALVAPAQAIAAQAMLDARAGDPDDVLDADEDLQTTLLGAQAVYDVAHDLPRSDGLCLGCFSDEQDLLDMIFRSRMAVAQAAHVVRELVCRTHDHLNLYSVRARLRGPAHASEAGSSIDAYVRGRALGLDTPVPAAPVAGADVGDLAEQVAQALTLPGLDDDVEAHVRFFDDGDLDVQFELPADSLGRAQRWAGWIVADLVGQVYTPLRLHRVDVELA